MAEKTKSRTKSAAKKSKSTGPQKRTGPKWEEAFSLECSLEEKILEDAILSARLAFQELEDETRKAPYERRSGLRLREKAIRTEQAFNRLRALRLGELLPNRHPDE